MPSTKQIIEDAESLPVEDRMTIVDALLHRLNAPDPEIDRKWIAVIERRLSDLRSGKIQSVPAKEVFQRVRERLQK